MLKVERRMCPSTGAKNLLAQPPSASPLNVTVAKDHVQAIFVRIPRRVTAAFPQPRRETGRDWIQNGNHITRHSDSRSSSGCSGASPPNPKFGWCSTPPLPQRLKLYEEPATVGHPTTRTKSLSLPAVIHCAADPTG